MAADSAFLLDALYCSEENWEEGEDCCLQDFELEEEEHQQKSLCFFNNKYKTNPIPTPMLFQEQDFSWEADELASLLSKESPNQLCDNLKTDSSLSWARTEAVEWMLKVNAHYSFSVLTALLAVNYLDRFFLSFQLPSDKPWMTQLAAVACVSLAAKVEETRVPLLLDLQVEDTKFIFEAKTIQRMEILVLSTLQWKMNPVTPLSFVDYIARRIRLEGYLCLEFLKRCDRIILFSIPDTRFMQFLPSVMASATMMYVVKDIEPCLGVEYKNQIFDILGTDKDNVENCSELVKELAEQIRFCQSNKRKFDSIIVPVILPGSPNGVMDVSFSSDSSNDSWSVASSSVSSSPEPLSKKNRAAKDQNHNQLLEKATPDFLTIFP